MEKENQTKTQLSNYFLWEKQKSGVLCSNNPILQRICIKVFYYMVMDMVKVAPPANQSVRSLAHFYRTTNTPRCVTVTMSERAAVEQAVVVPTLQRSAFARLHSLSATLSNSITLKHKPLLPYPLPLATCVITSIEY